MHSVRPDRSFRATASPRAQRRRVLFAALQINLFLFVVEAGVGLGVASSALLADSLDMLADASAYAASLFVLGRGARWTGGAALVKGAAMLVLGVGVLVRAGLGIQHGVVPEAAPMAVTACLALLGNAVCFALLRGHRAASADLRAAWLCSRNDLLGNAAVLLAAAPTAWLASPWPDAVVGVAIASLLIGTSLTILRSGISALAGARPGDSIVLGSTAAKGAVGATVADAVRTPPPCPTPP